MNTEPAPLPGREEVDRLLPWYATGRLSPDEAARVERALAADPGLRAHLAVAEEEAAETRAALEALPFPRTQVRDDVLARIRALQPRPPRAAAAGARGGLVARALAWLESLGPRNLAWAGMAAALLVVLQAGLLAATLLRAPAVGQYMTASQGDDGQGSFALVSFAPGATIERITAFLGERGFSLTDGPRGGLYRLRLSGQPLEAAELDRALAALRSRTDLVAFVAPAR